MIIERRLRFEAAHRNMSAGATGLTHRLHGHSYEVIIAVKGPLDPALGWVRDFADVKKEAEAVIDRLDHRTLNDVPGITDSTSSDIQLWLDGQLRGQLQGFDSCRVRILGDADWSPVIRRADDQSCAALVFGFAAAHFLPHLPETHKCRRVHGHSFQVRLGGRDATRLCDDMSRMYPLVDHVLLNDVSGLENPTSEFLACWLWERLKSGRGGLEQIVVAETCTSRCIYTGT